MMIILPILKWLPFYSCIYLSIVTRPRSGQLRSLDSHSYPLHSVQTAQTGCPPSLLYNGYWGLFPRGKDDNSPSFSSGLRNRGAIFYSPIRLDDVIILVSTTYNFNITYIYLSSQISIATYLISEHALQIQTGKIVEVSGKVTVNLSLCLIN
jgi:hypothetical protein